MSNRDSRLFWIIVNEKAQKQLQLGARSMGFHRLLQGARAVGPILLAP